MKDHKRDEKQHVKETSGIEVSMDESISKYSGPEFVSPKLEKTEKKFSKQVVHN